MDAGAGRSTEGLPVTTEALPAVASDAEVSLLGAAMAGYPDLGGLLEAVQPGDFYAPTHEEIWRAIRVVYERGQQPDPVTVRVALAEAGAKVDPVRLLDMTQLVPVVAQAAFYAERVVDASSRRAIQRAGTQLHQLAQQDGSDLEFLREQARQAVDEATRSNRQDGARSVADVLPAVLEIAQNGRARTLTTGWPDLDRLISGLAPGRLVIVGARPGVGKSLMGTNLALHFALHHEHAVLFASIEMNREEVTQRMLAKHAGVNLTALMDGETDERDWGRIAEKLADLNAMPLRILDSPDQTVTTIRREARNYQRQRDDLALIIVDYLQLMNVPVAKGQNRAEALGLVSRGLKLLARETGACVVAMAQVNREAAKSPNGRPRMSDLRESGSIEADADVVILLHQPDDEIPELEVIVDKNRHGPKGIAALEVHGHYARLASVAWTPSKAVSR